MQLPGYLRGRALQEWHLLSHQEQQSYQTAVDALQSRLDPRNRTMAAQEFRHSMQRQEESDTEFIRRIEKAYQVAYGKDSLNPDTRDTLLYSQLYDGLRYEIMRGPAVSGSRNYRELCVSAKGEEHRLAALRQRHQLKLPGEPARRLQKPDGGQSHPRVTNQARATSQNHRQSPCGTIPETQMTCYNCGKPGHMSRNCRQRRQESRGRPPNQTGSSQTRQIHGQKQGPHQDLQEKDPESFIRAEDRGSINPCVRVQVQGVPAYGLIDTGADITIIGGKLFKRVATVARLKKRNSRTYDQKTFRLDGRMGLYKDGCSRPVTLIRRSVSSVGNCHLPSQG